MTGASPAGSGSTPSVEPTSGLDASHSDPLRGPTIEQHAREFMGLPEDWHVFRWEARGERGEPFAAIVLTGAIVREKFTRGRNKGAPDWRKRLRETEMTITILESKHREWLARWEAVTGKCCECGGSGQEFAGWSATDGVKYRTCRRCLGTGVAPAIEAPKQSGE